MEKMKKMEESLEGKKMEEIKKMEEYINKINKILKETKTRIELSVSENLLIAEKLEETFPKLYMKQLIASIEKYLVNIKKNVVSNVLLDKIHFIKFGYGIIIENIENIQGWEIKSEGVKDIVEKLSGGVEFLKQQQNEIIKLIDKFTKDIYFTGSSVEDYVSRQTMSFEKETQILEEEIFSISSKELLISETKGIDFGEKNNSAYKNLKARLKQFIELSKKTIILKTQTVKRLKSENNVLLDEKTNFLIEIGQLKKELRLIKLKPSESLEKYETLEKIIKGFIEQIVNNTQIVINLLNVLKVKRFDKEVFTGVGIERFQLEYNQFTELHILLMKEMELFIERTKYFNVKRRFDMDDFTKFLEGELQFKNVVKRIETLEKEVKVIFPSYKNFKSRYLKQIQLVHDMLIRKDKKIKEYEKFNKLFRRFVSENTEVIDGSVSDLYGILKTMYEKDPQLEGIEEILKSVVLVELPLTVIDGFNNSFKEFSKMMDYTLKKIKEYKELETIGLETINDSVELTTKILKILAGDSKIGNFSNIEAIVSKIEKKDLIQKSINKYKQEHGMGMKTEIYLLDTIFYGIYNQTLNLVRVKDILIQKDQIIEGMEIPKEGEEEEGYRKKYEQLIGVIGVYLHKLIP